MPDIVLLVEDVRDGTPFTLTDKFRAMCAPYPAHYHYEILEAYTSTIGNRIVFESIHNVVEFDPNKKYFYYIPLDHWNFDFVKYFQMLGKKTLENFQKHGVSILFAHDLEMVPTIDFPLFVKNLEWLYLLRSNYGHSDLNLVFAVANDLANDQKIMLEQYFYNTFKFVCSPLIIKWAAAELKKHIEIKFDDAPKTKQFLCLNRGNRIHRIIFLHGLRAYNLMNEGHISNMIPSRYDVNLITSDTEYARRVKIDMSSDMPAMILDDISNTSDNRPKSIPGVVPQMSETYYDIVSETAPSYFQHAPIESAILTEKITKSLYLKRPFMINGGPGCLSKLKEYGFKTYDGLFDESYDNLNNFVDRHEVIIKNVIRYKNNISMLAESVDRCKDTIEYNYDHLQRFGLMTESILADKLLRA